MCKARYVTLCRPIELSSHTQFLIHKYFPKYSFCSGMVEYDPSHTFSSSFLMSSVYLWLTCLKNSLRWRTSSSATASFLPSSSSQYSLSEGCLHVLNADSYWTTKLVLWLNIWKFNIPLWMLIDHREVLPFGRGGHPATPSGCAAPALLSARSLWSGHGAAGSAASVWNTE